MTANILLLILAGLLIAGPAAADPIEQAPGVSAAPVHGPWALPWRGWWWPWPEAWPGWEAAGERPLISLMLRFRHDLGLTADQVQTLERLRAEFSREAARRQEEIRAAERDLAALLAADPVDLSAVESKIREIERLRADLRLGRIRTIEQGKTQLTPAQRERLRTLLSPPPPPVVSGPWLWPYGGWR